MDIKKDGVLLHAQFCIVGIHHSGMEVMLGRGSVVGCCGKGNREYDNVKTIIIKKNDDKTL